MKALPKYKQLLFYRLNEALKEDNYSSVLSGVKVKIKDIKNKEQNGEIKPV